MTLSDLHIGFKIELDKSNVSGYPSFLREEIDYFINLAVTRWYKSRYSGINPSGTSFQQNQKRSDDFKNIVKFSSLDLKNPGDDSLFVYDFPEDYWFMVGEEAYVSSNSDKWPKDDAGDPIVKRTDVIECTIENIDKRLTNSLSDHIIRRGQVSPLRVYIGKEIILYTTGDYSIENYKIYYISKPDRVDWYKSSPGYSNTSTELEIVPDHAWDEVLSMAVRYAIENVSDYRYATYKQESISSE